MANPRGPDFESAFGSRTSNEPLVSRLRDRRGLTDDEVADGAAGSISELVDRVENHRTVGDSSPVVSVAGEAIPPSAARSAQGLTPTVPSGTVIGPARSSTFWFRFRRRALVVFGIVVAAGLLYLLVTLLQVWSTGRADDEGPVDAIVVMGAAQYDGRPSPQLAARLDHVLEVWPKGVAPLIIVTGGNIPGDRFTEAEASATYLTDRGIPPDVILQENVGSDSRESLQAVAAILDARGASAVLIVTDPYHALRSRLVAEDVGLDASVSSTDTSVVTGFDNVKRHVQEAGGIAVGRIIGFERLDDLLD